MSYNSPVDNSAYKQNVGLDKVLNELQAEFGLLPWLSGFVFGRARETRFPDEHTGEMRTTPEIYIGNKEHLSMYFNDNLPCSLFFHADGAETINYDKPVFSRIVTYQRNLSLIFWGNLEKISTDYAADYFYTELIKRDLISILAKNTSVSKIIRFVDESPEKVFDAFTLPENRTRQLNKFPYTSLRIDFTVEYKTPVTPC